MLQIGVRIRQARLERGLSQGDLEGRTGLLRCYLSRVENGHTEPSLQTLVKLATALEMPLVEFFDTPPEEGSDAAPAALPRLSAEELAFLAEMRRCAGLLTEANRQQVLSLAKKMAAAEPASKSLAAAAR